jgi:hypothetical protein
LKKCCRCKTEFLLEFFSKDRKRKDGLQAECKKCCREQQSARYKLNPEPTKKRSRVQRDKSRKHLMGVANNFKSEHGCFFCKDKTICILDFHHIKKGMPVSWATGKGFAAFQRELDRCIILCANCHRKSHAGLLNPSAEMLGYLKADREEHRKAASVHAV